MTPLVPGHQVAWEKFKQDAPAQTGRIYRGEPSSRWRLESTLRRALPGRRDLLQVEADLLFRYQQSAANFLPPGQIPYGRMDWLASMQHHGAPTRLLDFTYSPYVAAYFAMEQETDGNAVIWSFDKPWLQAKCETILALGEAPLQGVHPRLVNWLYENDFFPVKRMVAPAGSVRLSQRQLAQQAVFAVAGDLSVSFEENIRAMGSEAELSRFILRYELRPTCREVVLEDLRLMNVNRMTLFPGLDGFAQSLRYSLVQETAEQRSLRAVFSRLASGVGRRSPVPDSEVAESTQEGEAATVKTSDGV